MGLFCLPPKNTQNKINLIFLGHILTSNLYLLKSTKKTFMNLFNLSQNFKSIGKKVGILNFEGATKMTC
jgi:hypothetical protein